MDLYRSDNINSSDRQQHHKVVSMFLTALKGSGGGGGGGGGGGDSRTQEGFDVATEEETRAASSCSGGVGSLPAASLLISPDSDPVAGNLTHLRPLQQTQYPISTTLLMSAPPTQPQQAPPTTSATTVSSPPSSSSSQKALYLSLHAKLDRLSMTVSSLEQSALQGTRDLLWYIVVGMFTLFVADQFLFVSPLSSPNATDIAAAGTRLSSPSSAASQVVMPLYVR